MVKLFKHKFIPSGTAADFNNLISITSKIQRRATSIDFLKKRVITEGYSKISISERIA